MSNEGVANSIIADPTPTISPAPDTSVKLLRGLYDAENDIWHTTAYVRELNGEDEEVIASANSKGDMSYAEYMSILLARAVEKIGTLDVTRDKSLVDKLMVGDRDLLFVGTVKATYGRVRELEVICSSCGAKNFTTINLDEDFKIDTPTQDLQKPLEVTLKDNSVVKLNYPSGADSLYVAKKAKTTAEQNTLMLARCSVWDSHVEPFDKEEWAKALSLSDRNKLVKALTTDPPGPKMEEVKAQCAKCQADLIIVMDWVSLLFG